MKNVLVAFLGAAALAGCQHRPAATVSTPPGPPVAPAAGAAATEAGARAAIGRYLQGQPNAALYVLDSARTADLGAYWQVLVPRTDWARRMPNRAAFEVDKQTGAVKNLLVK
ncbi:hypothetical protein ACFQ48_04735 [Hymenobacter caeli]|uniref:Lipoprotein n=1 Tax=Hymenobacter caeli TaxID=2735894 RepID=A0ABX2FS84_9BACT|nr:hypothetical protein [Hymenobacter caeli]NRT19265.1 hypothetical protein [Hymenobacter caeli]